MVQGTVYRFRASVLNPDVRVGVSSYIHKGLVWLQFQPIKSHSSLISSSWPLIDYQMWLLLGWKESLQPHCPIMDRIGHRCQINSEQVHNFIKCIVSHFLTLRIPRIPHFPLKLEEKCELALVPQNWICNQTLKHLKMAQLPLIAEQIFQRVKLELIQLLLLGRSWTELSQMSRVCFR